MNTIENKPETGTKNGKWREILIGIALALSVISLISKNMGLWPFEENPTYSGSYLDEGAGSHDYKNGVFNPNQERLEKLLETDPSKYTDADWEFLYWVLMFSKPGTQRQKIWDHVHKHIGQKLLSRKWNKGLTNREILYMLIMDQYDRVNPNANSAFDSMLGDMTEERAQYVQEKIEEFIERMIDKIDPDKAWKGKKEYAQKLRQLWLQMEQASGKIMKEPQASKDEETRRDIVRILIRYHLLPGPPESIQQEIFEYFEQLE